MSGTKVRVTCCSAEYDMRLHWEFVLFKFRTDRRCYDADCGESSVNCSQSLRSCKEGQKHDVLLCVGAMRLVASSEHGKRGSLTSNAVVQHDPNGHQCCRARTYLFQVQKTISQ